MHETCTTCILHFRITEPKLYIIHCSFAMSVGGRGDRGWLHQFCFCFGVFLEILIKVANPAENNFFLHFLKEKLFKSMSFKFYLKIPKITWVIANLVAPVPPKKKLKSDQNCSVQVNLSIGVFSDAIRSENFVKTSNVFISKLHFENGSQDFSSTTRPILFKFTYVKKVLSSEPGELFEKKICSPFI